MHSAWHFVYNNGQMRKECILGKTIRQRCSDDWILLAWPLYTLVAIQPVDRNSSPITFKLKLEIICVRFLELLYLRITLLPPKWWVNAVENTCLQHFCEHSNYRSGAGSFASPQRENPLEQTRQSTTCNFNKWPTAKQGDLEYYLHRLQISIQLRCPYFHRFMFLMG